MCLLAWSQGGQGESKLDCSLVKSASNDWLIYDWLINYDWLLIYDWLINYDLLIYDSFITIDWLIIIDWFTIDRLIMIDWFMIHWLINFATFRPFPFPYTISKCKIQSSCRKTMVYASQDLFLNFQNNLVYFWKSTL